MRRFFAPPENFRENEITLGEEEARHLRDVLRLRAGELVNVFDGAGNEFSSRIEINDRKNVRLRILEKVCAPAPESSFNLTLGVALLKGEKFDLVVQKATELGVTRIAPLETARADVKIKDEKERLKKIERWNRIALEACKQSGRAVVPVVEKPIAFEDFVKSEKGILFAERGGEKLKQTLPAKIDNLTVIIGAEGGWEESEIELARVNGFKIVTLGGRILRAETAAITIAALMQHLLGDLR